MKRVLDISTRKSLKYENSTGVLDISQLQAFNLDRECLAVMSSWGIIEIMSKNGRYVTDELKMIDDRLRVR